MDTRELAGRRSFIASVSGNRSRASFWYPLEGQLIAQIDNFQTLALQDFSAH